MNKLKPNQNPATITLGVSKKELLNLQGDNQKRKFIFPKIVLLQPVLRPVLWYQQDLF